MKTYGATLGNMWYTSFKPMLIFPTPKVVAIKDWRLAFAYRFLQLLVLIYFILNVFLDQSFLSEEIPDGILSMFALEGEVVTRQNEIGSKIDNGDYEGIEYCKRGSSYDFVWDERVPLAAAPFNSQAITSRARKR
ncbi:hypothetical protein CYMTET_23006 [Cymbomonas tetramitiformis]|uniref:Uncharacterized protein n=1 Tax=Cymbomonas tetramitiformis TaxID=36881 RepID=A0AAE0FZ35_9CHLO|nr:hypothetical protein CYMTET_23006 [Cymbomonas tetramitiformis]